MFRVGAVCVCCVLALMLPGLACDGIGAARLNQAEAEAVASQHFSYAESLAEQQGNAVADCDRGSAAAAYIDAMSQYEEVKRIPEARHAAKKARDLLIPLSSLHNPASARQARSFLATVDAELGGPLR